MNIRTKIKDCKSLKTDDYIYDDTRRGTSFENKTFASSSMQLFDQTFIDKCVHISKQRRN